MKRGSIPFALMFMMLVFVLASSALPAATPPYSDWVGVYARIDKVVFEPASGDSQRVQIWGAFALATKDNRDTYDPAERGYLYYSVAPGQETVCRREWADLKSLAGTGQIVGFGVRNRPRAKVHKATDKPGEPDVYPVGSGLVKMSDRGTNYEPIRALRALPK
jgi:hypothetical protein